MSVELLPTSEVILRVITKARSRENQANRRADRRYSLHARVGLGKCDPTTRKFVKRADAWARNISHSGMLLVVEEGMEPETAIDVDLEGLGFPGYYVSARAMRCNQLLPNTYEIGICFLEG